MIISGLGSGKGWEPENEREKKMWRKKNGLEREDCGNREGNKIGEGGGGGTERGGEGAEILSS